MVVENIVFGLIAAAMALGALGVVRTKNIVHAALYLVVVLAGGAAQFLLLGQEFVAWVQVLVYIGAVIVLFLFGIMLTRAPMQPEERSTTTCGGRPPSSRCSSRGMLGGLLVHTFHADKVNVDGADPHRRDHRARSSPPTSSRSKSSACSCSPRSSAPSCLARRD